MTPNIYLQEISRRYLEQKRPYFEVIILLDIPSKIEKFNDKFQKSIKSVNEPDLKDIYSNISNLESKVKLIDIKYDFDINDIKETIINLKKLDEIFNKYK